MALWDKITSRGNVEDRRGMSGIGMGGLGLGGIILYTVIYSLLGGEINSDFIFNQLQQAQTMQQSAVNTVDFEGEDQYELFASTVLGSNNELWQQKFAENNLAYVAPTLVLFRSATLSGCGTATSNVGPHYCPLDSTIYLDETFFDELTQQFDAQGGDVAEAYVIAHEVGHHVQEQLGTLQQRHNGNTLDPNELSVRIELQADCFAGIWANSIKDSGVLIPGEIAEAMDAAAAIGDDRIQEKVYGQINPESWTHGSSEDRVQWFTTGYESGDIEACDTF